MIKVRVKTSIVDAETFGELNFLSLPTIGSSFLAMDRNANVHLLKVRSIRQLAWPDDQLGNYTQAEGEEFGILLVCENDNDWRSEHSNKE